MRFSVIVLLLVFVDATQAYIIHRYKELVKKEQETIRLCGTALDTENFQLRRDRDQFDQDSHAIQLCKQVCK